MKRKSTKYSKSSISQYKIVSEPTQIFSQRVTTSKEAANYIRDNFFESDIEIYESFFLLLVNRQNRVQGYAKISQGGITGTVVDVKLVGKYILDNLASAVIICHNHPSGTLVPSEADIRITKQIKELCKVLDCTLLDHLILTKQNHYSFADDGTL